MKIWIVGLSALLILLAPAEGVAKGKNIRKNITVTLFKSSKNITKPNIPAPGGMEVNSFTGNLFHQREDVYIPARGLPIEVAFAYNSGLSKNNWGMGNGWTSTFNMMYEVTPGHIIMRGPDGSKDSFSVSGSVYTAPPGVFSTLTEYAPSKFAWKQVEGPVVRFDDATHKRVTSIEDRNGNTITFADFVGGQPTRITDANGRSIRLNWSAGKLVSVVDSIASPPRTTSYQYDARGNLKKVTYPLGDIYRYQYDARNRMTGFIDELGHPVSITYGSGGGGGGVSSVSTPGDATTPPTSLDIVFGAGLGRTDVSLMVFGSVQTTSYTFDSQKRLVQVQGPLGLNEQFTYDAQNNVTQWTNSGGQTHSFVWNSSGDMLSTTDPLGQTASWTYDPVYHLVTSSTDKKGQVTGILRDAAGNVTQISRPLGITETFTYSSQGDMTSATDGRGNTTTFSYNAKGYLTSVIRPIGSQAMSYDNSGNMLSSTDADGNTTVYAYDVYDRCVSMTNALGGNKIYLYGGLENLVQETDENGNSTTLTYDGLNRLISVTRPQGITLVARDEFGNVRSNTDFNGNVRSYTYDARNRLVSSSDPLGHSASITYDANSNVLSVTDYNGNPTSYTYDALNRVIQTTNALGHNLGMSHDPVGNVLSVTDENGHTTSYTYDALNRWTLETRPIGSRSVVYDNNDNVVSETDPLGHTTTYSYDALDRLITVLDPLLHSSSLIWSPSSNLLSMTDANGLTRSATYDALHRMVSSTNPMLEVTTFAYDAVGNRTSLSTPYGNTVSYVYDASNRLVSMSDGMGPVQSYSYDANSNRLTSTDPLGATTQYLYDVVDRLVSITAPLGQTATYAYDNNSNIVSTTNGEGGITTLTYDALNRMVSETFPGGLTTSMGYDPVGNVVSILDARGNTTTMQYNAMNMLTKMTYPDGTFEQCVYDVAINQISSTDQNGNTITHAYDAMNRLVSSSYPGGSETYAYDNGGRLIAASNPASTITMAYDGADRLLEEVLNGKTTSHAYNIPGRTVTTTHPSATTITNTMDLRLHPVTVATGAAPVVTYSRDAASKPVSQANGNGTTSFYDYDDNGWASSVRHQSPSSAVYNRQDYVRDDRGFLATVETPHSPVSSEKYTYDATTRLTGYKQGILVAGDIPTPVTQSGFTFDPVGNRSLMIKDGSVTSYTANNINAYTSISGSVPISPTYDANGNMISDGSTVYTYDHLDRLIGVSNPLVTAVYAYDVFSRRIQKTVNGAVTKYFYDGDQVIEERDGADIVTGQVIVPHHGRLLDDSDKPVAGEARIVTGGGGTPETIYLHRNAAGDPVAVTNTTGNVMEEYAYGPFGEVTFYDSAHAPIPASAYNVNPLYGGQHFDAENALYLSGGRAYNPHIGRYLQQDPSSLMGDPPDLRNGYSYKGNNPTNSPGYFWKDDGDRGFTSDPGIHAKPPIRRLKIRSADTQFARKGWDGTIKGYADNGSTAKTSRDVLKSYFETGKIPTEEQFSSRGFNSQGNRGAVIQFDVVNARGGRKGWDGMIYGTHGARKGWDGMIYGTHGARKGWDGVIYGRPPEAGRTVRPPYIPMGGYDGEGDARKGANESAAIAALRTLSLAPSTIIGGRKCDDDVIDYAIGARTIPVPVSRTRVRTWVSVVEKAIPRQNVPIKEFVTLIALRVAPPKREYVVQYEESDWDFLIQSGGKNDGAHKRPGAVRSLSRVPYDVPPGVVSLNGLPPGVPWEGFASVSKIPAGFVTKKSFGQLAGKK